jgi:hypothetical protein
MNTDGIKSSTESGNGKQPSWFRSSESDEESVDEQKQSNLELIQELEQGQQQQNNVNISSNKSNNNYDYNKDSDDSDDDSNRRTILPTNLQVKDTTTKRGGGLFRRGRRNDMGASVTTDGPATENDGSGSVTGSYMKGFCGKSVQSQATTGSVLSILSRLLPFGFNKLSNVTSKDNKLACPPLPPKRPPLPPSRRNTIKKKPPRQQTESSQHESSTSTDQLPIENSVHTSAPDSTPTHKSISTMDTEECTFEGGVPAVIYCFMKVNPYENDDDNEDHDLGYNNGGLISFLPKAIAKRLPKSKKPKQFIDENDEESYFQTLVAL